jgi:competence/damage-inducible protein CinA-like protein
MRCEVVAIGTELLLGQIVDTNSSWIGEHLALAGIDSLFQVKVGDNFERMTSAISQALDRSDAVICCGGLGPTQDDITRDVIAHIMGVGFERDERIVAKIRQMFEARGRVMTDNNRRQADIPVGAAAIPEMPGTAPGLVCPIGDKVIYAVPGVPHEMREMMLGTILPDLRRRSGQTSVIRSRVLKTWGMSESGLDETLQPRLDELDRTGSATIAFQASGIEGLKVRITAKAADTAAAEIVLAREEALVRDLLGDIVFATDDDTMESVVLAELARRGQTLAIAESLTGGLMATRMTGIDPAMEVFRGALVAPAPPATEGASGDSQRAVAAARSARGELGADIGIAAALPLMAADHAPGTVYLAVDIAGSIHATTAALPGDRNRLRGYAVISLLEFLRKTLASPT